MIYFFAITISLVLLGLGFLFVLKNDTLPFLAPAIFILFMLSASFSLLGYAGATDNTNTINANFITTNYINYTKNYLYVGNIITNTLYQNTNSSLMIIYARDTNGNLKTFEGNSLGNIQMVGATDLVINGIGISFNSNSMITLYVPYKFYYQFNYTGGNFLILQQGGN